jgi:hypothetical protein
MIATARTARLLSISAAASALLLAGCGAAADKVAEKATEKALESAAGGNVDIDTDGDGSFRMETDEGVFEMDGQGNLRVDTEDGSMTTASGEMPAGWPSDIPVPRDLEVLSGTSMDSADEKLVVVTGTTSRGAKELLDEMKAALSSWTISGETTTTTDGATFTSAQFELGDRRLMFQANDIDGETTLNLSHATKP